MSRILFSIGVLALALAVSSCASETGTDQAGDGGDPGAQTEMVAYEGVIVDMKCYSMNTVNNTNDHMTPDGEMAGCGVACATMGIPVGLLINGEQGGQLYLLVTPSKPMAEHMAKWARISGDVVINGSGLIPSKIEVRGGDGEFTEVKIETMM